VQSHCFAPSTLAARAYYVSLPVGAIGLTESYDLVRAVRDGFARFDPARSRVSMIAEVEADRPDLRMNDGACDRAGRFWAGTMALDERPCAGALYRLDGGGRVETMLRAVSISNGIDWTLDDQRMYYIDSPTQSVDVFDFDVA